MYTMNLLTAVTLGRAYDRDTGLLQ